MSWCDGFADICRADVPLADFTWYRLGGPARWLIEPRDEPELAAVLDRARAAGVAWRVLGRGANVLVRDEGFDGAVIRLRGAHFEELNLEDGTVYAAAGAELPTLIRAAMHRGLVGLEALAGVPGTVGGVIRMNAGGKYGQVCDFVRSVSVLERDGALCERNAEQVGFTYRHTRLDGAVVLGATLRLNAGDADAARRRYREIWNEKHATQPAVARRSAGCIFKNPPGGSAGKLLDEAGLKGQRVGGAEISPRHANFIVAHEGARARDVLGLIALARDRVWNASGVALELEIEVW